LAHERARLQITAEGRRAIERLLRELEQMLARAK